MARASAIADEATAEAETVGAALTRERARCDEIAETLAKRDDQIARDLEMLEEDGARRRRHRTRGAGRVRERRARGGGCETSRRGVGGGIGSGAGGGRGRRRRRATPTRRSRCRVRSSDADATKAREHAAALEEETGHLTAQIEAFAVVNAQLQDAATSAQSRLDAEVAKTANLKNQVATLEASLRAGRDERASGNPNFDRNFEPRWRNSRRPSRRETRRARRFGDDGEVRVGDGAVRTRRRARRASRRSVENLNKSKRLLQETMVEQLAAVRAQLERADAERGSRGGGAKAERLGGAAAGHDRERDGEGGGDGDGDGKAQGAARPPPPPPYHPRYPRRRDRRRFREPTIFH